MELTEKMKLHKSHCQQLLSYADSVKKQGWYYGNQAQFEKRHDHIIKFLEEEMSAIDKRKVVK